MQFFSLKRSAPATTILLVLTVAIVFFIGFGLFKGLHRYHGFQNSGLIEKQAPAGFITANLSDDGLEVAGWAPPQSTIQILDHDKILAEVAVDVKGQWAASLTYEKHGKNFQILNATYQEKDKAAVDMGEVSFFMPGRSLDDSYVWWESDLPPRLLQAPVSSDEGDLSLALAWLRDEQAIIFAGRAVADSLIQLYVDGELVGTAPVSSDGAWTLLSLLKPAKKIAQLRFDEIQGGGVVERRSYRLDWTEGKDNWILSNSQNDGIKELIAVLKSEAGEALDPHEAIPGQIIPLMTRRPD